MKISWYKIKRVPIAFLLVSSVCFLISEKIMAQCNPTITANGPTNICPSSSLTLDAGSGYSSYEWSTGETTETIQFPPNNPTLNTLDLAITNNTDYFAVEDQFNNVYFIQSAQFTLDANNDIVYQAGGNTYTLMGAGTLPMNFQSLSISPYGGYVQVLLPGSVTPQIVGQIVIANITSGLVYYGYNLYTCTGAPQFATPGAPGFGWLQQVFTATVFTTTSGGCVGTASLTITGQLPDVTITPSGPTTICPGSTISLDAGSGYTNYLWATGENSQTVNFPNPLAEGLNLKVVNGTGYFQLQYPDGTSNYLLATQGVQLTINQNGEVVYSSGGMQYPVSTFQPIPANSQSITVAGNGLATVTTPYGTQTFQVDLVGFPYPSYLTPLGDNIYQQTLASGQPTSGTPGTSFLYGMNFGVFDQSLTAEVTVTALDGCTGTASITLNYGLNGVSITPPGPLTINLGQSVALQASSGYSYAWSSGETTQNINFSSDANPLDQFNLNIQGPGFFQVQLSDGTIAYTTNGNFGINANGEIVYVPTNNLLISNSSSITIPSGYQSINIGCDGTITAFVNGSNIFIGQIQLAVIPLPAFLTPIGNNLYQATAQSGQSTPGYPCSYGYGSIYHTYNESVTVANQNGCSGSATVSVTVLNAPLVPVITANGPTTFCPPGNVTLDAGTDFGCCSGTGTYLWSDGESTETITVSTSGIYTVTLTASNGYQTVSNPITVTVGAPVTITPNGSTNICGSGSVIFDAGTGHTGYLWSNGATTEAINYSGAYSSGGNNSFTLEVTVTDASGCTGSGSVVVTFYPPISTPVVAVTPPATCDGNFLLNASSGYSSYNWSNGATGSEITADLTGNYTVTVTNQNGCTATSGSVTVVGGPHPIITSSSQTVCPGSSVTLSTGSYSSYLWSSGETTQSITFPNPFAEQLNLSVINGNGYFVVQDAGGFNYYLSGGQLSVDGSGNVIYTASGVIYYLQYFPGSNTNEPTQNLVLSGVSMLSIASNGTVVADGNTLGIIALAWFISPLQLTSIGNNLYAGNYYSGAAEISSPGVNGFGYINHPLTETVTVTDANGCTGTASITLSSTLDNVTINPSTPVYICQGESTTLTAGSGYSSYLWNDGESTQSISFTGTYYPGDNIYLSVGCDGYFQLQGPDGTYFYIKSGEFTFDNQGIIVYYAYGMRFVLMPGISIPSDMQTLTITSDGIVNFTTSGGSFLPGQITLARFTSPDNLISYGYNLYQESLLSGQAQVGMPCNNGLGSIITKYQETVTASDANGCSGTASVWVTVYPPLASPVITTIGTNNFCSGGTMVLDAGSPYSFGCCQDGINYLWSTGATTETITINGPGTYSVTVSNGRGCSGVASVIITDSDSPIDISAIANNSPVNYCDAAIFTITYTIPQNYLLSSANLVITKPNFLADNETYTLTSFPGGTISPGGTTATQLTYPVGVVPGTTYTLTFTYFPGCVNYDGITQDNFTFQLTNINGCGSSPVSAPVVFDAPALITDPFVSIIANTPSTANCGSTVNVSVTVTYNASEFSLGNPIFLRSCPGTTAFNLSSAGSNQPFTTFGNCINWIIPSDGSGSLTVTLQLPVLASGLCGDYPVYFQVAFGGPSCASCPLTNWDNESTSSPGIYICCLPPCTGSSVTANFTSGNTNPTPFTNTSTGADSYVWDFGDGTTSTDVNPSHQYLTGGYYNVCLRAISTGTCSAVNCQNVCVPYTLTLNTSKTNYCVGNSLSLSITSTLPSLAQVTWTLPDGSTVPNTVFISHLTSGQAGTYTVSVATIGGCLSQQSITITVDNCTDPCAILTVGFSAGAGPNPIQFTSTIISSVPIVAYYWSFGDGTTSSAANPLHEFALAGNHRVCLTVIILDNNGNSCCDSSCQVICVTTNGFSCDNYNPTFYMTQMGENTIEFTNTTYIPTGDPQPSYLWTFDDGGNVVATDVTHIFSGGSGSYYTCLTVLDPVNGTQCSGELCQSISLTGDLEALSTIQTTDFMMINPIPASDYVEISYKNVCSSDARIVIYNGNGDEQFSSSINPDLADIRIDIRQWATGFYTAKLFVDNQLLEVKRFSKAN